MMVLAMLLLPWIAEEIVLPPKRFGEASASLSIRVADQTPRPGTARVRLRVRVEGPPDLAVEWLEDAEAAWRVTGRLCTSSRTDERGDWECALDLVQTKPGAVPLPGVRIRVHSGGLSGEIAWHDLLQEPAEVAPIVEIEPPPPSAWPARLRWFGLGALGLVGITALFLGLRRMVSRPAPPMPPVVAALAALDRVIGDGNREPLVLVADVDGALRAYLETRGVPARRMSCAEMLARPDGIPELTAIIAILSRGEELKFGGAAVSRAEVQDMAKGLREVLKTGMGEESRKG